MKMSYYGIELDKECSFTKKEWAASGGSAVLSH